MLSTFSSPTQAGERGSEYLTDVTVVAATERPNVTLHLSPASAVPGQPITFDFAVTGTQGLPAGWTLQIAYGDGPPFALDPAAGNVSHTYTESGTYVVLLGIINASGESMAVASGAVQVGAGGPGG